MFSWCMFCLVNYVFVISTYQCSWLSGKISLQNDVICVPLALRSCGPLWNNGQQVSPAHTVGCHYIIIIIIIVVVVECFIVSARAVDRLQRPVLFRTVCRVCKMALHICHCILSKGNVQVVPLLMFAQCFMSWSRCLLVQTTNQTGDF